MTSNRTIWIIAEGDTERAAASHLKTFLDLRAGDLPKVRLRVLGQDGGLKQRAVHGQARNALVDAATVGVIALTDVYPEFKNAAEAKVKVQAWLPNDGRCFAHVACHDFEAKPPCRLGCSSSSGGCCASEAVGITPRAGRHGQPSGAPHPRPLPTGKAATQVQEAVDGKKLFEKLQLDEVAEKCPEFKAFLNRLLDLAGYPTLP